MSVLNYEPCYEDACKSWGGFLRNLGARGGGGLMVRFTPGRVVQYTLDKRVGEPYSQSENCGEEKNLLLPSVIETRPACSLITMPTELARFLFAFKVKLSL
jgi:hypothetical protein